MAVELLQSSFVRRETVQRDEGARSLRLVIDDRSHGITRPERDGAIIVDYDGEAEPGQVLAASLVVALDGFDVTVPTLWEVIACLRERRELTLRLAPVNEASHHATIVTVLEALRSGEVLGVDDFLGFARMDEPPAAYGAPPPEPAHGLLRQRFSAILFTLLALVLLAFIGLNLAAKAFYVHADGAISSPPQFMVQTPEEAELVAVSVRSGTRVSPGTPIATIKTVTGQQVQLRSRCDCIVTGQLANMPVLLRRGQTIARLVPAAGVNEAVLTISLADMRRVKMGDQVTVRFYDSDEHLRGTVSKVSPPKLITGADAQPDRYAGTVTIRFDRNVPPERVGQAVTAKVRLSHLNPFA